MKRTISSLASIALLALVSVAAKATPIVYDFSGAVTQVSGIYGSIALGATVTGSYTFDLSNANPDQSSGVVGSPSASWSSQLIGGSFYFGPLPAVDRVVFSSVASVGGFTYTSLPPSTYQTASRVLASVSPPSTFYEASEAICESLASCRTSVLLGSDAFGITYTSEGLPNFSANPLGWSGAFSTGAQFVSSDFLQFSITSLTPATAVPEPSSLAFIVLAMAGLGFALVLTQRRAQKR